ncbi:MAG: hypothetical protein ACI4GO_02935, partial [Hominenteromicrobium sp.]
MLVICALTAGLSESMRLKTREKELEVFLDALSALKSAAAYTAGDLAALLTLCKDNSFLRQIAPAPDPVRAWVRFAQHFFTGREDRMLAEAFIRGYGKTDLDGQLAYIELFETRTRAALQEAKRDI